MSPLAYSLRFHMSKSYTQLSIVIAIIVVFTIVYVLVMKSSFTSSIFSLSSYAFTKEEFPRIIIRALVGEIRRCVIQALLVRQIYKFSYSFLYQPPFLKVFLTSCIKKFHVSVLFISTFCSSICCLCQQQHLSHFFSCQNFAWLKSRGR